VGSGPPASAYAQSAQDCSNFGGTFSIVIDPASVVSRSSLWTCAGTGPSGTPAARCLLTVGTMSRLSTRYSAGATHSWPAPYC